MHRFHAFAVALTVVAATTPAKAEVPALPAVLQVLGNVTNAAKPVGNALVIALNLNSLDAIETFSANDGSFVLPPLPAAVYRIIAVKSGFLPAMAMVLPTQKDQRIKLRLDNQKQAKGKDPNQAVWELRACAGGAAGFDGFGGTPGSGHGPDAALPRGDDVPHGRGR